VIDVLSNTSSANSSVSLASATVESDKFDHLCSEKYSSRRRRRSLMVMPSLHTGHIGPTDKLDYSEASANYLGTSGTDEGEEKQSIGKGANLGANNSNRQLLQKGAKKTTNSSTTTSTSSSRAAPLLSTSTSSSGQTFAGNFSFSVTSLLSGKILY
jgi:hypothetical protein